jgi:protein MpaA
MLAVPNHVQAPPAYVRREVVLGKSEHGRPVIAWEIGDPQSRAVVLVVGCIHGNEPAGIAVANTLVRSRPPAHTLLWVVPVLNPDGLAAGTRQNGRGVDLNRNFPWRWRPLGPRGSPFYAGTGPMSEQETRLAVGLIVRVHPRVSVWFHQHLDLVDESGGDVRIERRFAKLVGMRTQRLPRYPGGVVNWENARFPGTTSFVVELPGGAVPAARLPVFADALRMLLVRSSP